MWVGLYLSKLIIIMRVFVYLHIFFRFLYIGPLSTYIKLFSVQILDVVGVGVEEGGVSRNFVKICLSYYIGRDGGQGGN